MTMVGVLLAIVGGLVAWFAYAQATQGIEVVATARHIAYGATITEADLRPVEIPAGSTLRVTAWSDLGRSSVRSRPPTWRRTRWCRPTRSGLRGYPPGVRRSSGSRSGPGGCRSAACSRGTSWRSSQPAADAETGSTGLRATVLAIGDPDAAGRRTVDLIVPDTAVDEVAAAAGNDNTLLVLVGSGG